MAVEPFAVLAALLFGVLALYQGALALGAPWGAFAYGGRAAREDGTLSGTYRLASAAAAVLLVLFAILILIRAGVVGTSGDGTLVTVLVWVIVGFLILNTLSNLSGRSRIERFGFGGITIVLVALCALVAVSGP